MQTVHRVCCRTTIEGYKKDSGYSSQASSVVLEPKKVTVKQTSKALIKDRGPRVIH